MSNVHRNRFFYTVLFQTDRDDIKPFHKDFKSNKRFHFSIFSDARSWEQYAIELKNKHGNRNDCSPFKLIWRLFSPFEKKTQIHGKNVKMKSMEMNVIFFLFSLCMQCVFVCVAIIRRNSFPVQAIYHWMCHWFLLKTNLKVQRIQMAAERTARRPLPLVYFFAFCSRSSSSFNQRCMWVFCSVFVLWTFYHFSIPFRYNY